MRGVKGKPEFKELGTSIQIQENVYVMWSLMEIQCEIEVNQNHPLEDAYVRTV